MLEISQQAKWNSSLLLGGISTNCMPFENNNRDYTDAIAKSFINFLYRQDAILSPKRTKLPFQQDFRRSLFMFSRDFIDSFLKKV